MPLLTHADDPIVTSTPAGVEAGWFDRFYTNVHSGSRSPLFMIGAGVYPAEGRADGYAMAVTTSEQVNLRVADMVSGRAQPTAVGPLSWETLEPLRRWRVRLADNPSGIACDLLWTARTSAWECAPIVLDDGLGDVRTFDHAFQSGFHEGWIEIDGVRTEVSGWTGQRDRSRGKRHITARQGVHVWVQGQFAEDSVAFLLDLGRDNEATLLDGAVLEAGGTTDRIVAVEHELTFTESLECTGGRFGVGTESGRGFDLLVDATTTAGGFLEGAGYGRFHGAGHGPGHLEHDRWALDDPNRAPRNLHYPLTDRLSAYTRAEAGENEQGSGVLEFAHSRSPHYTYVPGLARA